MKYYSKRELYALGEALGDSVTEHKVGGGRIYGGGGKGGGGGGQQNTQQQNQYSALSPWAQPYISSLLGAAQQQVFDTRQTAGTAAIPAQYVDSQGNRVSNEQAASGLDISGNPLTLVPGTGVAATPAGSEITGIHPYNAYGSLNAAGGQYGLTPSDMAAANAAVAGFTPLQQQAYQGAGNLQTPGQFGSATNLAGTAGYGALGTTGQAGMYGQQGSMYGQQGAQQSGMYGGLGALAGQQYAGLSGLQGQQGANIGQSLGQMSTNPNAVQSYMNPYIQASLAPQLQLAAQQYGMQGAAQQGAATQAGAFGGSRNALMQGLNQQNQMLAQNQIISQGYNTAFNNAQNQMNAANQAALAGNQQALSGYNQAGSQALQGYGMGLTGASQAGNLGIAGAQSGLSGVGAQQAGYGLAGNQGTNLANIGTGQLAAQQGILGLQNQFGGQQQQQAQNVINAGMTNYQTAQQYPMTQLSQLKNLISGIPVSDVTTTQQQVQPSTATQLAGLGTAGVAGLALAAKAAKGGIMKSYATGGAVKFDGGGIASLNRKALLAPETMSPQTLQRSTQDGAIAPQVSGIAKAIQLNEQVNGKNAEALSKPPVQGTIMDELEAKASQMDQAQSMEEAIPKAMAVLKHKMDKAIEEGDMESAQRYAEELQQLAAMAQQQAPAETPSAPAPEGIQQLAAAPAPEQQGIETVPSNLPTQAMAKGGSVGYAPGGVAQMLRDADEEEVLAAEDAELYGSGTENDFIQSIMPAAKQSGTAHPSAAISVKFEPKDDEGIDKLSSHKYASLVAAEAKRQGRDPNVILQMLQKETGGLKNPETARSKAGAIGIAQFMPKTAKQYGINPEVPEEAAYGMVKHFGYLEDKYKDPKLAMAAYNWGEGNLNKWLKEGADPRKMPRETRQYASLAQGGIAHYDGEEGSLVETPESKAADELARERARGTSTAGVNQRYIESLNAAQNTGPQTNLEPKTVSGLEALQAEILQDIRARRDESKKTREQNNLLALMQAGFGAAASKNIAPLGAIGEGGAQGLGALAQYRKQEGDEAKDIAAQQIGLYRFGASAENAKVLQEIKAAQQDLRKGPEERARDEAEREYARQVAAIDKRQAEQAKQAGGELEPYYQEQYDAQRSALRKQIYEHFKVPVQTEFKLPPIKPKPTEVKPTGYQSVMPTFLGGMSKEDMDALQWANEHPDDPRADAIKKRLGK